ncbi:MAG: tRNA (adenosine(37)-N6)-threonylcarbamoyltransferase complex dimerization subunit type 1 TsaB [Saprospiraceae bacterium]|nr:tRNA (adenosine(37)-N6)-threonylcarbamoyltransferase complex dimerization subunit type 1 TsaB [Saprospiraceae bacterium]
MALILLLETSTDVCSVALSKNGIVINIEESLEANTHTEKLTILIKQCLDGAGYSFKALDAVALAVTLDHTSLRIGTATAKGICYAMGIPLITLSSLYILASGVDPSLLQAQDVIISLIDARRMEAYAEVYDHNLNVLVPLHAIIFDEHSFGGFLGTKHLCGDGAEKFIEAYHQDTLKMHHNRTSAQYMAQPAERAYIDRKFSDVAYFTPEYFKVPSITKSEKKLF